MAIKFTWAKLPVDEDGKAYDSLGAFQIAQIAKIFSEHSTESNPEGFATCVVENDSAIMEILELTTDARPSARGKPKPRKAKQQELPKVQAD